MFRRSTNKPPKAPVAAATNRKAMNPSVIASNMSVLGNIISDGILDIDGQVDGNVRGHIVTVRPEGRIRGDVMAEEVYVHGTIDGLIKANAVTLYATAHVTGTVMHESLTVEDGAAIDGKLKRTERLQLEDQRQSTPAMESVSIAVGRSSATQTLDSMFDNDNDEPQSEAEIRVLENLRLIS